MVALQLKSLELQGIGNGGFVAVRKLSSALF
jgi:hypothetical protein